MGKCKQSGSSLVEVMVALFVLAIGLLGVLGMQAKSIQYNQSAHVYTQAVYLANDIAERIRSNTAAATSYDGTMPTTATKDCTTNACDGAELSTWDRVNWSENVTQRLPAGEGSIKLIPVAGQVRQHLEISVAFDDSRSDEPKYDETRQYIHPGKKIYTLVVEI
jgi:type IV pilus assembly protein PilV